MRKAFTIFTGFVRDFAAVESLLTLVPVQIESEDIVLESLRLYEEEEMKFGDAMVMAKSRVSNIQPVYTFDKKDFKRFSNAFIL